MPRIPNRMIACAEADAVGGQLPVTGVSMKKLQKDSALPTIYIDREYYETKR